MNCILLALVLVFSNVCTLAFLEWNIPARNIGDTRRSFHYNLDKRGLESSRDSTYQGNLTNSRMSRGQRNQKVNNPSQSNLQRNEQWSTNTRAITVNRARKTIERMSSQNINIWMDKITAGGNFSDPPIFGSWSVQDQIEFIKLLQQRRAYEAILIFLDSLGNQHVKVCTTAAFAMALSSHHRDKTRFILDRMDQSGIEPTSLTFIALLGSVDGPSAASKMMKRIKTYNSVKLDAEVFNSAIYACRRVPSGHQHPEDNDWQMALQFFQQMRRERVNPTVKTYHAILHVLSRTGKVQMAVSLMQQLKNTKNLVADDKVWTAAINVCAQAADDKAAVRFINDMQECGCQPNLRHCSALLKAFAQTGQDQKALMALEMMLGKDAPSNKESPGFELPPTAPDLIALNTIVAACAKNGNFEEAKSIFDRISSGEFRDPISQNILSPDRITYHTLLAACQDPESASDLVKEMRLSRRNRYGAVPPTNVTYARAINVCQKSEPPDLEGAERFLRWAQDDGITPTVFMYGSAIWAAQRSGECLKAFDLFSEMKSVQCSPNAVAYNGVISALCDHGNADRALAMYEEMKHHGFMLSAGTSKRLVAVIQSSENPDDRIELLVRIVDRMNTRERTSRIGGALFEALISAYGSQGRFEEAHRTYETIVGRVDGPCLRAILLACGQASPARWLDAATILHTSDIVEGTSGPGKIDQIALSNAIIACSKADQFEEGLNLLSLYGIPDAERSKLSPNLSVVALNALIAACGRGCRPDLALAVFNEMQSKYGIRPDARTYRSAVIACNQAEHERRYKRSSRRDFDENYRDDSTADDDDDDDNDDELMVQWWECGLALLRRMREENIKADVKTLSSAISACEAAGEWQRALGVLQMILDDSAGDPSVLNLYCFNAAISACEKGGAWVEALELYERMLDNGGSVKPNFVTLSSLVLALDRAGQKELAQSKYDEGRNLKIVNPWRWTRNQFGESLSALDLHRFSSAMAKAALRSTIDSYVNGSGKKGGPMKDLVIITGKGLNSMNDPVLKATVVDLLQKDYGLKCKMDDSNQGRLIVGSEELREFVETKSWR